MGDLVDSQEEGLVRCPSNDIGGEDELPAERVGVSKEESGDDLKGDDGEDEVLGGASVAHEFGDLSEGATRRGGKVSFELEGEGRDWKKRRNGKREQVDTLRGYRDVPQDEL